MLVNQGVGTNFFFFVCVLQMFSYSILLFLYKELYFFCWNGVYLKQINYIHQRKNWIWSLILALINITSIFKFGNVNLLL